MSDDPRHLLGRLGEDHAAAHLERRGFRLLARNHRTRYGELDLVGFDGATIVFAEVKTRRAGSGHPWDGLDQRKRTQVRNMARAWLADCHDHPHAADLRFDAIGVIVDARNRLVSLDHLEAAF
jgi:putative endonuclease